MIVSYISFIHAQHLLHTHIMLCNISLIDMLCHGTFALYTFASCTSPRAHLHVVGMLQFMSDINQQNLPTLFYFVLVSTSIVMALSTVFHSMNSPDNSPFSRFCYSGLISALLVLYTICLFTKVSFSPDIIPSG